MGARGPKPRPALTVLREGNVNKRPIKPSMILPPSPLVEPSWLELLPGRGSAVLRSRQTAHHLWQRVAPTLERSAGLVGEQQEVLVDYCITWARIEQGERAMSKDGVVVEGLHNTLVKNPWVTVLNQYRSHLRSLVGELGLSPSAATRITKPKQSDDDDPFD